jgi:hypothetical protein
MIVLWDVALCSPVENDPFRDTASIRATEALYSVVGGNEENRRSPNVVFKDLHLSRTRVRRVSVGQKRILNYHVNNNSTLNV